MENYQVFELKQPAESVLNSFGTLPNDQYIKSLEFCYRKRCYSTGYIDQNVVSWDSGASVFMQTKSLNQYLGEVQRTYQSISEETCIYLEEQLLPEMQRKVGLDKFKFGVHQIRIIANDELMGKPAPEGIHQDGFDYVCVCCTATHNLTGGNSILVKNISRDKLILDRILKPGECLLFDDKEYAHYVSPIVPKLPGLAYRDVFVITIQGTAAHECN